MRANERYPRTVAILGAGCAGTLLAAELCQQHFAGRIELFDVRTNFTREQRWCFWRGRENLTLNLPISAEWSTWQVADRRRTVCRRSASFVYSHVYAPEFYRRFHGRLATDPRVRLRFGCRVSSVRKRTSGTGAHGVQTDAGELLADVVIDARHESTPAYMDNTTNAAGLVWQSFYGRMVRFGSPRFEPARATLMDFRVPAAGTGLAFAYVLPFSTTSALVEAVMLDHAPATASRLRTICDAYLDERFGAGADTLAVEEGLLPMTGRAFAPRASGANVVLGVGGGAARPSSGYAFANMVCTARQTAAALCAGQPLRQPAFAWKYRALDTLFLRLLKRDPAAARRAFMAMFAGVEPARLVRFLTEASSWQDDLALGFALPKAAFLKTLLPPLNSKVRRRVLKVSPDAPCPHGEPAPCPSEYQTM